jgi:hypothetical protein
MLAGTEPVPGCVVDVVEEEAMVVVDEVPALGVDEELQAASPSAPAVAARETRRGLRIAAP